MEHTMDDSRIWPFETSLWLGSAQDYRDKVDPECVMVLPDHPFVVSGSQAIEAVEHTPRWNEARLTQRTVARPHEGMIVLAYHVEATREDQSYSAYCTSTYHRLSHDTWKVVQHQQTPLSAPMTESKAAPNSLDQVQRDAAEQRKEGGYQ
jgi:hypothetical protein